MELQTHILSHLIHNEEFCRRVVPYLRKDYFEGSNKIKAVPSENHYSLKLKKSDGKLIFSDDEQKGTWSIEDSILSLESIPVCTTFVDSIFLINDAFGNSSLMLKNGDQKLGIVSSKGIEPEKII